MNKSSELVATTKVVAAAEPHGASKTNSMERMLEEADQAVRMGKIQESREHLTRIFEHLAGNSANRIAVHPDPQYRVDTYQMRRTA